MHFHFLVFTEISANDVCFKITRTGFDNEIGLISELVETIVKGAESRLKDNCECDNQI